MRLKAFIVTLLVFVVGYAQAQRIVLTPHWIAQSQFAGYYAAQELGYYEEAGLDVVIEHTTASETTIKRMNEGRSNATTMMLIDAMFQIDQGADMVNILQTSQRPGLVFVPRNEQVKSIDELRNGRVGIWRSYFSQLAQLINQDYQLNLEWVRFIQSINLYISGAIDAQMAMTYNEMYWIRVSGFENIKVINVSDLGYDYPEDGLYISGKYYRKYPEKAKAFAEASRRGWLWVHENPDKALDMVIEQMEKYNLPYNRNHQRWMLEEILRLQLPEDNKKPTYTLDAEKVADLSILLRDNNRIKTHITFDKLQGK